MVPKLVLIAAVIAIPLAGVAGLSAAPSVASATPPPPNIVCHLAGSITFPAPGLSADGVWTMASTSAASISATFVPPGYCPGGSPHMPPQVLTMPNIPCLATGNPAPVCPNGTGYVSDWANGYVTAGATFWTEFPLPTRFHIDNTTYKSASTASTVISPGGICGANEPGFKVNGHLTVPILNSGDPTRLFLCLDGDTGTATTGNFLADLSAELGGGSSTISSVEFDPTTSKLRIT